MATSSEMVLLTKRPSGLPSALLGVLVSESNQGIRCWPRRVAVMDFALGYSTQSYNHRYQAHRSAGAANQWPRIAPSLVADSAGRTLVTNFLAGRLAVA